MLCFSDPQATPKNAGTTPETNKVQIRTRRCQEQFERTFRESEGAVLFASRAPAVRGAQNAASIGSRITVKGLFSAGLDGRPKCTVRSAWSIAYRELVRDFGEWSIRGIQEDASDECRCNEMCIDPSDATTEQAPNTNQVDHLSMRDCRRVVETLVKRQRLGTRSSVAYQQLSEHHLVAQYALIGKQSTDHGSIRLLTGERSYPHRSIDENH
jgi:hypothetical protein